MSYSRFRGAPVTSETTYEYDDGVLVQSATTTDPEWTDVDRGLLRALLAERADVCGSCGHPTYVCRDRKTAGSWMVVEEICQPSRVAQVAAEEVQASKRRGVVILTKRS